MIVNLNSGNVTWLIPLDLSAVFDANHAFMIFCFRDCETDMDYKALLLLGSNLTFQINLNQ